MQLKKLLLWVCFYPVLASPVLKAGSADSIRTFQLEEIKIVKARNEFYNEDKRVTLIGADRLSLLQSRTLGELLSQEAPISVKSYGGSGSLSTLSMRGTYANHTQVAWNGFPLNSVTTGDVDLSLIPVSIATSIRINHGAAGSIYGSGTFGGSVDILTYPNVSVPLRLSGTLERGSFNDRFYGLSINQGKKHYGFSFAAMKHLSDNNFTFNDRFLPGSPPTMQVHNKLQYTGFLASVYFMMKDNSRLESGIWYQDKYKEIPEIMGSSGNSNAIQKDSSLKVYLKYLKSFEQASLTVKAAWFSNYLQYSDKANASDEQYTVYTEFLTHQLFSDITIRRAFSEHFTMDAGFVSQLIMADVRSYGEQVNEFRYSLFGAAKYSSGRLVMNGSARNEWSPGRNAKPLFSIGGRYESLPGKLFLRANFSGKYRLPTLNEKYWMPGGNPNISPEEGWSGEFGSSLNLGSANRPHGQIDITAYSSSIRNMIQWSGEGNALRPVNFKKVWTRGLESHIDCAIPVSAWTMKSSVDYNFTLATNQEVFEGNEQILGKQLRYVPKHSLNSMINFNYRALSLGYVISWSGSAYITDDNLQMPMPAYTLSHLNVTGSARIHGCEASLSFRVSNLFDRTYQVMEAYPMPGRAYFLKLTIGFTATQKDIKNEN
jgi:vitamin B12 transporter